jgi:PAS domain S-box-containing protein
MDMRASSSTNDWERAARVEHIAHVGSWEWNVESDAVWWSDELYRIYGMQPGAGALTFETFLERVHPEDRARVRTEVKRAYDAQSQFGYFERIVRPDASVRELETHGDVRRDARGKVIAMVGVCRDVTERERYLRLREASAQVLEAVATGSPLAEILERIVRIIEDFAPGTLASILLLDRDRLVHGAAPSLPKAYVGAIDGSAIGPKAGSCGTAAFRGEPVYVVDIAHDPLWDDFRALALEHGLAACWSTPFFSRDRRVLGTFALYYRSPLEPSAIELELIERAVHLTGIAVENRQLDARLRALTARAESVREDERKSIAREIHDQLGQALTALKLDLAHLGRMARGGAPLANETVAERSAQMALATDELLAQVRRISSELRPPLLDDLGLSAAVEWQAQQFEKRTGIPVALKSSLGEGPLPADVVTAVFRVFQEALTNVARHAQAKHVEVSLDRSGGALVLEVRDDGRGFANDVLHSPRALGLLGMRERAVRLGGVVQLTPRDGGGSALRLMLPLGAA